MDNCSFYADVEFFVWSSFNNEIKIGKYYLMLKYKNHIKTFQKNDIQGHSSIQLTLEAIHDGLDVLKKPCNVCVCTNAPFGISSIYTKQGNLRNKVKTKYNIVEKEKIRSILQCKGHILANKINENVVSILKESGLDI